jgi:hypothetical protein
MDNAARQTEPSKAEPPKRNNRRWLQFSLRTLMLMVTLAFQCAVCLPMLIRHQGRNAKQNNVTLESGEVRPLLKRP